MPVERQVRHSLEVARALSAWNRTDEALSILLDAEQAAPEQVRHHYLSRELVIGWIRGTKGRSSLPELTIPRLARRITAGIQARTSGVTAYLEHGNSPETGV
ncbi:hypothetical protein [Streptomyces jumonjinensis]|uniref:hypothetical protein n=1 Tax=Streptomyces jumonjinensis TaxID=1945 RepID=UPI0037A7F0EA